MSETDEDEFTPRDEVAESEFEPEEEELPEEIRGWNWGAFLFNWIWGLGNKTYIALIALVFPPMAIVLGLMGNKWAWRNKEWDDVDHFLAVQRRWSIAGAALFVLLVIGVIGGGFWNQKYLAKSPVYRQTLDQIAEDNDALRPLGGAFRPGWYVLSDLLPFGGQSAIWYRFPIAGPKGTGEVEARAEIEDGNWELTSISIAVDGGETMSVRLPRQLMKQSLAAGKSAIEAGDGGAAIDELKKASGYNSPEAAYLLGAIHADGVLTEVDYEAAKRWLQLAIERGFPQAEAKLEEVKALAPPELTAKEKKLLAEAEQLDSIRERIAATDEAMAELQRLAEGGNPEAQTYLADLIFSGLGPKQSFSLAASWYRRAAEAGNAEAQYRLGVLYLRGNALPRSVDDARKWLAKAVEQDHEMARMELRLIGQKVADSNKSAE